MSVYLGHRILLGRVLVQYEVILWARWYIFLINGINKYIVMSWPFYTPAKSSLYLLSLMIALNVIGIEKFFVQHTQKAKIMKSFSWASHTFSVVFLCIFDLYYLISEAVMWPWSLITERLWLALTVNVLAFVTSRSCLRVESFTGEAVNTVLQYRSNLTL